MDLAFAPWVNTPGINPATGLLWRDATKVFQPEAQAWAKIYAGEVDYFDNLKPPAVRKKQVLDILAKYSALSHVAFFCHGWNTGFQAGFSNADVKQLAKALVDATPLDANLRVSLFCCSTGGSKARKSVGGDDGFADLLRDRLCEAGQVHCRVMGHTIAAHATINPYARFFDGTGVPVGAAGGYWIVAPESALWAKWKARLKRDQHFRLTLSDRSLNDIHETLAA